MFEELRNDHIAIQSDTTEFEHRFYTTLNQRDASSISLPSPSMKVLNHKTKPRTFKKKIQSCDLLIMDLMSAAMSGGLDEIEQVIKMIKDLHSSPTPDMKD